MAHEYEKVKNMAAVSLAYKCVEVAYLKTTYCKSPNATKDRHELQSAFQILPPGYQLCRISKNFLHRF